MNAVVAAAGLELFGKAVWLRPFEAHDLDDTFVDWLNDPQVMRYSNQRFVRHSRQSCARQLAGFAGGTDRLFSLRLQSDGRAIGAMSAHRSAHHRTAAVGILVGDTSVWGQGHGQDGWNTLLDWLLDQPGLRKVTTVALDCDHAMRRLAERSGMQLEGVRRAQELIDGRPWDILLYARFAGEPVNPSRFAGVPVKHARAAVEGHRA